MRARLRDAERAVAAAVRVLELLLAENGRVETVVGCMTEGLEAGLMSKQECVALLDVLREAGWRFAEEVDVDRMLDEIAERFGLEREEPS